VSENITQPYRFTGRAWDSNSSLYFYRTRYYDPDIGLFSQKDGLWETLGLTNRVNLQARALLPLYNYTSNNPVNSPDPWGEVSKPCCDGYVDKYLLRGRGYLGKLYRKPEKDGCVHHVRCVEEPTENWRGKYYSRGRPPFRFSYIRFNAPHIAHESEFQRVARHEIEHALHVCGRAPGPDRCLSCMRAEMRAYYCEHPVKGVPGCDWPTQCWVRAWRNCSATRHRRGRPPQPGDCSGSARNYAGLAASDPPKCGSRGGDY